MGRKLLAAAVAATIVGLGGCASQPKEIQAQSVSTVQYENYTCNQVAREMDRVNDRLTALHALLKKKADDDAGAMAVGIIIFLPALFFLEGGDGPEAQEYGRLRGEMDALQKTGVQKDCTDLPEFEDPIRIELEAAELRKAELERESLY